MGKYALLIGIETYGKDGEVLQTLPAAPKDVAALREVLLNPKLGGFDEAKPLINPTQPEMAQEIELWFQDRQPEDLVLLFFSGHGFKDERHELYFAAADIKKQRDLLLTSTATPARAIRTWIDLCRANYKVLILDCCFSGAFGNLVSKDDGKIPLKELLGAKGQVVLTSTSAVDYAFEEKDADLSIYTRYLVEGIATGAADEDGDGAITAEELHRYADRKVQETSPAMTPKIFIPQGEGYRIKLARSPQDDPKLRYLKEVKCRVTEAEVTPPARRLLIRHRAELGLSDAEAEAIEAKVLKPYREYRRKCQEYQDTLHQCLKQESSLNPRMIQDLQDYREHLQLKPKDVAAIEREALSGHDLERYVAELENQQEPLEWHRISDSEHQQQTTAENQPETPSSVYKPRPIQLLNPHPSTSSRTTSPPWTRQKFLKVGIPLGIGVIGVSALGLLSQSIDYSSLESLLQARDWHGADKETKRLMLQVATWEETEQFWGSENIERFSCKKLHRLDDLWVKYSNGKFGFSVQAEIWQEVGSPIEPGNEQWQALGDRVGWRKDDKWVSNDYLVADSSLSPAGEFPMGIWWGLTDSGIVEIGGLGSLFSRCDL